MEPKAPLANCNACPLKDRIFVASDPYKPDARFTIVGESPGDMEAGAAHAGAQEASFIGPSGKLLWATMAKAGVHRAECNVTNAVLCWPLRETKDEDVAAAAACCRPRLVHELSQDARPVLILGKVARQVLAKDRGHESQTTLHGRWMPIELDHQWVGGSLSALSTHHPAFIIRAPDEAKTFFEDVLKFCTTTPHPSVTTPTYTVITTTEELTRLLGPEGLTGEIAFDLETSNVNFVYDRILLMTITDRDGHAFIIPGAHPQAPINLLYDRTKTDLWTKWWNDPRRTFIAHNGKFDVRFLRYQLKMAEARVDFDTMLAHYTLDERKGTHDLKGLSSRFLNVPDYEVGLRQYLATKNDSYAKIPWEVMCQYAAWDAVCTLRLKYVFTDHLLAHGMYEWPFTRILMPLQEVFTQAELRGFRLDTEYLAAQKYTFDKELEILRSRVWEESKHHIDNPNSPAQVKYFLYTVASLKQPRKPKIAAGSTGKETLELMRGQHPVIESMLRYRKIAKMQSSYVNNLLDMADDDSDIHADGQLHGTETGRPVVKDPALQTIPRADEKEVGQWGKIIRDAFVAREGYSLLVCDYSQAELRVGAAISGETFLIEAYAQGKDVHAEVAIPIYGPNYSKNERNQAKMVNFSYLYGGSEYSLAQTSEMPIERAKEFIRKYEKLMPRLKAARQEYAETMKKQGYVQYRTGRRRRIPFIHYTNQDEARKAAFNAPIQGGAADLTNLAAIRVNSRLLDLDGHILLLVYDSIISEVPTEGLEECARLVTGEMVAVGQEFYPEVKWRADAEGGPRWGTLQKISLQGSL